ncbi:MAG: hypothetical protein HXM81_09730 [Neisseria sicca]|jgi:hypothetical protein|uniref:Uncharacterized protein n=1 Tax=Neisseria sicca VK64 TaxID=1095748 RepID=I2NW76_NEISI|nr:hypothetical protein [Neisseria sicca]EIG30087.1 hypothetical protein HMPREF1051_1448 [Neisseria sicca VK64]MBF1292303.1 hypothetical protein [Neisseria sicca]
MGGRFRGISGKGLQSVYVQEKRYLSDGRLRITRKPLIDGKWKTSGTTNRQARKKPNP